MALVPFTLRYPGRMLAAPGQDNAHQACGLFHVLDSALIDASVALGGYIESKQQARVVPAPGPRGAPPALGGEALTREEMDARLVESERCAVMAAYQRSELPPGVVFRLPFFYGRAFLFALHSARDALAQLASLKPAREAAVRALEAFDRVHPDLTGVRNSAAHVAERVQGLRERGQRIEPAPINTPIMQSPGGAMIVENLFGDCIAFTMADGRLGSVAVTLEAFTQSVAVIQALIDALRWEGIGYIVPRGR